MGVAGSAVFGEADALLRGVQGPGYIRVHSFSVSHCYIYSTSFTYTVPLPLPDDTSLNHCFNLNTKRIIVLQVSILADI